MAHISCGTKTTVGCQITQKPQNELIHLSMLLVKALKLKT